MKNYTRNEESYPQINSAGLFFPGGLNMLKITGFPIDIHLKMGNCYGII
jgi:hypothetical protein